MSTRGKLLEDVCYFLTARIDNVVMSPINQTIRLGDGSELCVPGGKGPIRPDIQFRLNGVRYFVECKHQSVNGSTIDKMDKVNRHADVVLREFEGSEYWLVLGGKNLVDQKDSLSEQLPRVTWVCTLHDLYQWVHDDCIVRPGKRVHDSSQRLMFNMQR